MSFTADEKKFLKALVQKEQAHYEKENRTLLIDVPLTFLKGGHDYKHFLEQLLKKL
jgi:hypothetical protein